MTRKEYEVFLEKYIPSADMKNIIIKKGHVFSDWDKAAIIWNSDLPLAERSADIKAISNATDDVILQKQIEERLAYDQEAEIVFIQNTVGFVYELKSFDSDPGEETIGFYGNYHVALRKGEQLQSCFCITKHQVIDEQTDIIKPWVNTATFIDSEVAEKLLEMADTGLAVSEFHYDEIGNLLSYYTYELPQERDHLVNALSNKRFENKFVPFPNPFKYKEEVRLVRPRCPDYRWGAWIDDTEDTWEALIKRATQENAIEDYSDANLRVKIWNDETLSWEHEHVSPIYLKSVKAEKAF